MKTIDMHVHLLNSQVSFERVYDRVALAFFAKKCGIDMKELKQNPYNAYMDALLNSVRNSLHVEKIALFGVDAKVDEEGNILHKDKTVCASNEDVAKIYEKNKDIVIPFFSINPKRPDALELIDKYYALGFKGAKFLQNYWGVDTRDKKYLAYFEKLASLNLPLIIHVGSESSVSSEKECESIQMLDAPLKVGVKVICAHMALSYERRHLFKAFSKKEKYFNDEYFLLLEMLKSYDNLYADISALLTPVRAKVLRHLSKQDEVFEKLLYASDFPVPFSTLINSYDLSLLKRISISREKNTFDRYAKAILEYFPKNNPIYTNYQKVL
jgi:predicted TIM-barrel fold metal-dependent hydrolase